MKGFAAANPFLMKSILVSTGYYILQFYEREFYTETGGTISIKYASFLGFYFDVTDDEENRKTSLPR